MIIEEYIDLLTQHFVLESKSLYTEIAYFNALTGILGESLCIPIQKP